MRVPVCTNDLQTRGGFLRIAKKLQQKSPPSLQLTFSSAQQILARGLGYHDLHDLQRSAADAISLSLSISQADVRDGINTALYAFCKVNGLNEVDPGLLSDLVAHLPLHDLFIFRTKTHTTSGDNAALKAPAEASKQPRALPEGGTNIEPQLPEDGPLSALDLSKLWNAVQAGGVLRDQCLFQLLLTGRRLHQIRALRACDISDFSGISIAQITAGKSSILHQYSQPTITPLDLVSKYIRKAKLSPTDYLFHRSNDRSAPMSSDTMKKIIKSYFRVVGTELSTPHEIRKSVAGRLLKISLPDIQSMMGHKSSAITSEYISRIKKSKK